MVREPKRENANAWRRAGTPLRYTALRAAGGSDRYARARSQGRMKRNKTDKWAKSLGANRMLANVELQVPGKQPRCRMHVWYVRLSKCTKEKAHSSCAALRCAASWDELSGVCLSSLLLILCGTWYGMHGRYLTYLIRTKVTLRCCAARLSWAELSWWASDALLTWAHVSWAGCNLCL